MNTEPERDYHDHVEQLTGISLWECPTCHLGRMICIEVLKPIIKCEPVCDTS